MHALSVVAELLVSLVITDLTMVDVRSMTILLALITIFATHVIEN